MAGIERPYEVDFERDVHAIAGLPFDAIDVDGAVRRLREAAFADRRCVVSTANLNFVFAARRDAAFRDAVCRSDLVVADGMPIVWMARLLGIPIRERVSGADLFEALCAAPGAPVSVFFYGGPPGAAGAACTALNRRDCGLRCVGFEEAPFAPLQVLSSDDTIARINESGAQFVIVALGAAKGQAWIERNRGRLMAPLLCHLGAVVNFAAGAVRRAPPLWQRVGLEWLWRIFQEPSLWRRYRDDGLRFLRLLAREVLPWALLQRRELSPSKGQRHGSVEVDVSTENICFSVRGDWRGADLDPLRHRLRQALNDERRRGVVVGTGAVTHADSALVGLLILAKAALHGRLSVIEASPAMARVLKGCGAATYLTDAHAPQSSPGR